MDFGIASVAGITMICYLAGMGMKASEKVKNEVIPVVCGCAGTGSSRHVCDAGFPGSGCDQRGGGRHCFRPGGHGNQPGSKATGKEVIPHLPKLRRVIRGKRKSRQEADQQAAFLINFFKEDSNYE